MAPEKLSVSMNATEPRFFSKAQEKTDPPHADTLARPIAGVVGGINDRLDFSLLQQCADRSELGTLLLVGPVPETPSAALQSLLEHPKCVSVGRQPHDTIHQWFQCLDVGLIPYTPTEFNRLCSPMRLFDHLASGAPVVATEACDQAKNFPRGASVCASPKDFMEAVRRGIDAGSNTPEKIRWADRAAAILKRIKETDHA